MTCVHVYLQQRDVNVTESWVWHLLSLWGNWTFFFCRNLINKCRDTKRMSAGAILCVCVCCASCSLWVLFRSECVSLFACVCVPAALHPCRRANLLATSHSSFPEKEVLSRWQSHDAPLPSRCCNGRRWLQPRRGRKWGICLFLRGRYSAFYFSVPH